MIATHIYKRTGWMLLCISIIGFNSFASQTLPVTHYKYRNILGVCQKIAAAKGDGRKIPALEVIANESKTQVVAQFKQLPTPKIFVDEKLYDVCRAFGKDSLNALACIVGHELAHYYENHSWANNFADLAQGMALPEEKAASSGTEKIRYEAEADYFGVFYGFLAGYETFRILPQVLDKIYQEYNLPETITGYPAKQERIAIAKEKVKELMPLVNAFKAAQVLYLIKNYEEASVCFDFILSRFPGKEIYNNAGVVKLVQASQLIGAQDLYFAYPFELDAQTRLNRGSVRAGITDTQKIYSLLKEAKEHFEKSINADPVYPAAYINLSCVYSLQNNQEAAIGKINELEQLCKENNMYMPANAYLIRGIAQVKNKEVEKARNNFETAYRQNAYLAEYNMALYKKLDAYWKNNLTDWLTHWPTVEKWIGKFWGDQQVKNNEKAPRETGVGEVQLTASHAASAGENLMISNQQYPVKIEAFQTLLAPALQIKITDYTLLTVSTPQHYSGKTAVGVGVGTAAEEVLKKYGKPTFVASGAGTVRYYGYENARIIFTTENESITGWTIYKIVY